MSDTQPNNHGIFSPDEWLFFQNCLGPLRQIFREASLRYGLVPYAGQLWPFLGLRRNSWFWSRRLELMLQPEFMRDQKVVFELRFLEAERLRGQVLCEFYCGRYDVRDFADRERMTGELCSKLELLGMFPGPRTWERATKTISIGVGRTQLVGLLKRVF